MDPIDVHSGDFVLTRQDVFILGRGLSVDLTFTYRSRSAYNGHFGYGWDMSYNRRVRKLANGNLVVLRGSNRKDEFTFSPPSTYTPPPGVYDTLVQNVDGTYTLTSKHGDKELYDVNGNLTRLEGRNGNAITFTYDPAGLLPITGKSDYFVNQTTGVIARDYRLTQITDATGRTVNFAYTAEGRVSTITYAGRTIRYEYDATGSGDLLKVTSPATTDFPSGTTMTYTSTKHNIETIRDQKGQVYLTNVYDASDRVISQTYGTGTSTLIYGKNVSNNATTEVIDRRGFRTLFTFDTAGHIIKQEEFTDGNPPGEPFSYVTQYEYDSNGERTRVVSPRGNSAELRYDAKGNVLEIRRKRIGAAKGVNDPTDLVTTFTYEPEFNFVKTATDPRGNTTTYTYDYELAEPKKGNVRRITFPSVGGQTIEASFIYNSFGQVLTATDPNGNVTQNTYDPTNGYLTQVVQGAGSPEASTTKFAYDTVGNVTSVTDPNTHVTTFEYNALNQLTKSTAPIPFSLLTHFTYDANGNLIQTDRQAATTAGARPATGTTDPLDTWQSAVFTYTILDQVATIKDDLGNVTTYTYDEAGNRKTVVDAKNQTTTYDYDERDLVWKVTDAASPAGVTETRYDKNGNLASLIDAKGNTTSYTYDDFDRLTRMAYADGSSEQYAYDAASNLISLRTPNSALRTFSYDALNRLTQKVTPEETTTYAYDRGSRLTGVSDADAALTYVYDTLNRVTQVTTDPAGSLAATTVSYQYDKAGNRTRLTYPDADVVTYTYDALNRLDLLKDAAAATIADFDYDVLSRRTKLMLPTGLATSYSYDGASRLTSITTNKGSTALFGFTYTYDALGNRLTLADGAGSHTYTYDPLSQVTNADYPSSFAFADTAFAYDKVGNRTSVTAGTTTGYTANPLNQYTQVGASPFTHDPNGNLMSDGTNTYAYDSENRLVGHQSPVTSHQYTYDPLGRRLSKTTGGITTRFLYDGDQLLAETDGSGTIQAKYVCGPGIDEPLRMVRGSTTSYYHVDGLGSVVGLTDTTGAVIEQYRYDIYGKPATTSALGNRFLFTGREYDAETGLYSYRARYYNPSIGRFLQRDPVGYSAGLNLYSYVDNNPVNFVDPDGQVAIVAGVAVGIVAVGTITGAVLGGISAFQSGEEIFQGVARGSVRGFAGSVAGIAVTLSPAKHPTLIGASAATAGEFAGQGFDYFTRGKSFDAGQLAWQAGLGAILGPIVSKAIPLRGPAPNLLKPRVLSQLLRPNTKRLFRRTGVGGLYRFFVNQAFNITDAEAVTHENKK